MRKLKKRYKRPRAPWETGLIEEEKKILQDYGLRRKKEIWVARALLRDFRRRARQLTAIKDKTREKTLLDKINKLGLKGNSLDDVLSLTLNDILERRLQTIVFRRGITKTVKQARQFIVHGHIAIDGRKTNVPSYIVPINEESQIGFYDKPISLEAPQVKKPIEPTSKQEQSDTEIPSEQSTEEVNA